METHISWIVLTGQVAYKIKKPVQFAFLDYSTPARRYECCLRELEINRRFAPGIYESVVPIRETPRGLAVGPGEGTVIDHAVRMVQFDQADLLDRQLASGTVSADDMDSLAGQLAAYHAAAERVTLDPDEALQRVVQPTTDNFDYLLAHLADPDQRAAIVHLQEWTRIRSGELANWFARRAADGFFRACHGDLHLANLVRIDGRFQAFDAIEFNDSLSQIDVMDEISFLVMELHEHGYRSHSRRLINHYVEATADQEGLRGLRFYLVYRAMVRAKVDLIRQTQTSGDDRTTLSEAGWGYVHYARRMADGQTPELWIMHGVSGSGKSTVALRLVQERGLFRLRSDHLRKQLLGQDPLQPTPAERLGEVYAPAVSARVYQRLEELARTILQSGFGVVVDATFLRREDRARFAGLATACGVPFRIAVCQAPQEELEERLLRRRRDPSDATVDLLQSQRESCDPLDAGELLQAVAAESLGEIPVGKQVR